MKIKVIHVDQTTNALDFTDAIVNQADKNTDTIIFNLEISCADD